MNIKDIARIANVSASTVSKIINGKHDNISEETCERVRKVVKEYNYAPYANSLASNTSKTFLIGLMLRSSGKSINMVDSILRQARIDGYGVITCISDTAEDEMKNIAMLLAHRVDGVLWQQVVPTNTIAERELTQKNIPFYTVNMELLPSNVNLCMDFQQAGYFATETLVKMKHQKIACIHLESGADSAAFQTGYMQCLYDNNIVANDTNQLIWSENPQELERLLLSCTGFICFNDTISADLICRAERKGYRIPRDLSIVSLSHEESRHKENLSVLALPYADFGVYCFKMLIAAVENKKQETFFHTEILVCGGGVDMPFTVRDKKIVVVGAMNVDTLINVGHFPRVNETFAAKDYAIMPGGRGINQAIGAAKLGADVYLVGRRGADFEGNVLIDSLLEHHIDVSCIKSDPNLTTGRAYVHVRETGESSIVVCAGANKNLTPADIEDAASVFKNAVFCLLQTDTRMDTVLSAARMAKKHGVKTLLKPSFISDIKLPEELLKNVDILLPNLSELDRICSGDTSLEEKAQYFLDKGVSTVIVTLSEKGCYMRDGNESAYFPAIDVQPVDKTGAADAFAAALVTYLTEGCDIAEALRYANIAAGLSATRQGVTPALPDRQQIESFLTDVFQAGKK